ncbi:MAG: TIGR02391 family protein [Candidatus Atribacteria bacterium]
MEELKMSFDPNTIQHLGIKMYSSLPTAIAELVANAYDACSPEVHIKLYDNDEKKIVVEDTGIGMTFEEINSHFLRIGRNRREEEGKETPCGRIATGKKGLGKLAFFGIGNTINITTKKYGKKTTFILDWNDLIGTSPGEDYKPKYKDENCEKDEHGTKITLLNLKRKINFSTKLLKDSLAKLFNFPDEHFKVIIYLNEKKEIEINNKSKYANIESEFEWKFPDLLEEITLEYENKPEIKGKIITTEKPLKPGMRGITLFANGRMINLPEFFGSSQSSHFFSYVTGWLDVDFVDNWDEDVISTNRQSINWETDKTGELKVFIRQCLSKIQQEWREKRKKKRTEEIKKKTQINFESWYEKLPSEIHDKVESVINPIIERSELPEEEQSNIVGRIHNLIPEYPYYHWRHLHSEIHKVSEEDYKNEDYLRAAQEAAKRYENIVKYKSGINDKSGQGLMMKVFGKENGILLITNESNQSEKDVEEGQRFLSAGVITGFRNPTSHEEKKSIYPEIFDDKDCLDILSLVSYLLGKLDMAKKRGD